MRQTIFETCGALAMSTAVMLILFTARSVDAEPQASTEPAARVESSAARAEARLKSMADHLAGLRSFRLEARLAYDVSLDSGRLAELGSVRRMTVRRPDRARIEIDRRSGASFDFAANGKTMTAIRKGEARYAREGQPENLDEVVDALVARMGLRPPLIDLLYSRLWDVLRPRIVEAEHLGEAVVDGFDCDHLYFENAALVWQVWVERGDRPLLRRLVVRYKQRPGVPTLRVSITQWQENPELSDDVFELQLPSGAAKESFDSLRARRVPAGS